MKTLELSNGDLVIGPGGFATIDGTKKVYQDLSVLVREAIGEDRFHPQWGGVLQEFVGQAISPFVEGDIRNEIQRLIQNYMVMQARQITADITMGRKSRFKPEEIVESLENIQFQQEYDRINVKVTIRTVAGESIDILRTVQV
jgi:phage baseplate assembly protein W